MSTTGIGEPAEVAEPTERTKPTEPSETTEFTEPTTPSEINEPTEFSERTETTERTEFTETTQTTPTAQATPPTETTQATEHTDASDQYARTSIAVAGYPPVPSQFFEPADYIQRRNPSEASEGDFRSVSAYDLRYRSTYEFEQYHLEEGEEEDFGFDDSSARPSARVNFAESVIKEVEAIIALRNRARLFISLDGGRLVERTPPFLDVEPYYITRLRRLHEFAIAEVKIISRMSSSSFSSSRLSISSTVTGRSSQRAAMGQRVSMEDVIENIGSRIMESSESEIASSSSSSSSSSYESDDSLSSEEEEERITDLLFFPMVEEEEVHEWPYGKAILTTTECMHFYRARSITVPKGTRKGNRAEYDNKVYDHLTIGKGRVRRKIDAEGQTRLVLSRSRCNGTKHTYVAEEHTYVSPYEMYDTYIELGLGPPKFQLDGRRGSYYDEDIPQIDEMTEIIHKDRFGLNCQIIERILAANLHKYNICRYRGMFKATKLDKVAEFRYRLDRLFTLIQPMFDYNKSVGKVRKAVSDISFNANNGDIIAVGYGLYSYSPAVTVATGNVCVWNMKNPEHPERSYRYSVPVTSVEFSQYAPCLLAIGLADGSVEVRNITKRIDKPLAKSRRGIAPSCEPIVELKWFQQEQEGDLRKIDPFLALSLDGTVTRFRVTDSKFLVGFRQMVLQRVEGHPEGLRVRLPSEDICWQANRHPLGMAIGMNPYFKDLYYVCTDEGCLHKCSLNYTHQYLEVYRGHAGAIHVMDFNPWSPKLFLTCSSDWNIHVWMDGVVQPLFTLRNRLAPVHYACWSRSNSTIIVALNRITLDIWDISRSILKPCASHELDSSFNTLFRLSLCSQNIAIGNERGNLMVCRFESMPFPPYYQYEILEKSIKEAISESRELKLELKAIGYFGYPRKRKHRVV